MISFSSIFQILKYSSSANFDKSFIFQQISNVLNQICKNEFRKASSNNAKKASIRSLYWPAGRQQEKSRIGL